MSPCQTVARSLSNALQARHNCIESKNDEWFHRHSDRIEHIVKEHFPSGSGFDNGTQIDLDKSSADKLVFTTAFHHMSEHGYYDGWSEHIVTVTGSLSGLNIKISGRDRNDIKEYIHTMFYSALTAQINPGGDARESSN